MWRQGTHLPLCVTGETSTASVRIPAALPTHPKQLNSSSQMTAYHHNTDGIHYIYFSTTYYRVSPCAASQWKAVVQLWSASIALRGNFLPVIRSVSFHQYFQYCGRVLSEALFRTALHVFSLDIALGKCILCLSKCIKTVPYTKQHHILICIQEFRDTVICCDSFFMKIS